MNLKLTSIYNYLWVDGGYTCRRFRLLPLLRRIEWLVRGDLNGCTNSTEIKKEHKDLEMLSRPGKTQNTGERSTLAQWLRFATPIYNSVIPRHDGWLRELFTLLLLLLIFISSWVDNLRNPLYPHNLHIIGGFEKRTGLLCGSRSFSDKRINWNRNIMINPLEEARNEKR